MSNYEQRKDYIEKLWIGEDMLREYGFNDLAEGIEIVREHLQKEWKIENVWSGFK